jgi:hypothetical protein
MRLIDSKSFQLTEHGEQTLPKYSILSHRWLPDSSQEVSFEDLTVDGLKYTKKLGFAKLQYCQQQSILDRSPYFWVDTCCIFKSSSAELSEAINSMYRWYQNAEICYVYIWDVSVDDPPSNSYPTVSTFEKSDWFLRGWTLQELIAPKRVVFYSKEWKRIGTRSELSAQISKITGINRSALERNDINLYSIADRMSWASSRTTSRIEDIAYSLLGIFNVNMPLLYGEGEKAFIRLQEEILKTSDDQSIFSWPADGNSWEPYMGLLARSPAAFVKMGAGVRSWGIWSDRESSSMTSKGLRASLLLKQDPAEKGRYYAYLDCHEKLRPFTQRFITLQLVAKFDYGSQFVRVRDAMPKSGSHGNADNARLRVVYVRQNHHQLFYPSQLPNVVGHGKHKELFCIRTTPDFSLGRSTDDWDADKRLYSVHASNVGSVPVIHGFSDPNLGMFLLFSVIAGEGVCRLVSAPSLSKPLSKLLEDGEKSSKVRIDREKHGSSLFASAVVTNAMQGNRLLHVITLYVTSEET